MADRTADTPPFPPESNDDEVHERKTLEFGKLDMERGALREGLRTFEVEVRKVVVDSAGFESKVPISVPVEIGIFDAAKPGEILGEPLYVQKHDVHSGTQTISIKVSEKPARGGIDPYNLLDWQEGDNIEAINVKANDEQTEKEIIQ